MADFDPAWDFLMHLEGGSLMHRVQGDPGGRTRFGIAENRHPDMWRSGPPSEAASREFYVRMYWTPLRLGEVENQTVADEIFEFAVNATTPARGTPNAAVLVAQEAANLVREADGLPRLLVDGLIGPRTLGALNGFGEGTLQSLAWDSSFNLRQLRYYRGLKRHLVDQFFLGWSRRVIA